MTRVIDIFMDYRLSIETATLILAIIGGGAVLFIGATLMAMVQRQRRDLIHGRTLAKAILQLSLQIEAEERKTRQAVKSLISALTLQSHDFSKASSVLDMPPDFLAVKPELEPHALIEGLVNAMEGEAVAEPAT